MKKSIWFLPFFFLLVSCKSEFETVRTSNDYPKMYKKALEYYDQEEYYKAQELFKIVLPYYRGKEESEDLYYKYTYTHYYLGEYILASQYFKNFSKSFYNSPWREEMEFMAAYSHYQMSPNYKLDQTYTQKAIEEFQLFVNRFPESKRIPDVNKLIDEMRDKLERKSYDSAKLYYDIGEYAAAKQTFGNFLTDYPGSVKSEEARFLRMKAAYTLAEDSVFDRKEERYNETIRYYNEFIKRHARSKWIKDARDMYNNSIKELEKITQV